jgi:hypothetical protein
MLKINENERASLSDIIKSDWVTNNGTEIINFDGKEENDSNSPNDKFGNINRLLISKSLNRAGTLKSKDFVPFM